MAGLRPRRRGTGDPRDAELAGTLEERRAAVREAEAALIAAQRSDAPAEEVAQLRRLLQARLDAVIEAAEAGYRHALGPVADLSRVAYLARLTRPEVRRADATRRELRLARTHYRMAERDDLWAYQIGGVPPTVGTQADQLATRAGH
jgi:hypothetical protein